MIKEKGDLDRHSITMKEEIKVLTKALDMKIKDINAQIQKTLKDGSKPAEIQRQDLLQHITSQHKIQNLKNALTQLMVQNKKLQREVQQNGVKY